MLEPCARLLGRTVTGLWQLAAVSDDGTIPLPGHLVFETGDGFVPLSYTQGGLSCTGPVERGDVRWETEPWLAMGRSADAEEWLELVPPEDMPAVSALYVTAVAGWFGVGAWVLPLVLRLSGDGDPIVLATTGQFELLWTDLGTAVRRAGKIAPANGLCLTEEELRL